MNYGTVIGNNDGNRIINNIVEISCEYDILSKNQR